MVTRHAWSSAEDAFYFSAGVLFLALAKIKNRLLGYTTPKPFSFAEADRCIDYDIAVADEFLGHLKSVGGSIDGKRLLELGPGSDLGVGLYLVARGATDYTAFDRFPYAGFAPAEFYDSFSQRLRSRGLSASMENVRFVADNEFRLRSVVAPGSIDIAFSNAAFEHFDDVDNTIAELTDVVKPKGLLVATIDLQTHSRWIRDTDPNNIYRYPQWLYRWFYFPGQPNRMRPDQYITLLQKRGWTDISIVSAVRMDERYCSRRVDRSFRADQYLDCRSITICAVRPDATSHR
jgi:SAM-dependent methyltransferase